MAYISSTNGVCAVGVDLIEQYFAGEHKLLVPEFDDAWKFSHSRLAQNEPGNEVFRDQIKIVFSSLYEAAHGRDVIYVPTAISKGERAFALVARHNANVASLGGKGSARYIRDLMDLDIKLGSETVHNFVVKPNSWDHAWRVQALRSQNPQKLYLDPCLMEAVARELSGDPSFARARWRDAQFMGNWWPVIDVITTGQQLGGDWPSSWGSEWEVMRGIYIQAGFRDPDLAGGRRGREYEVLDYTGQPLTLHDRLEPIAFHIKQALAQGLYPKIPAEALARGFAIDDMRHRRNGLDRKNAHPIMVNVSKREESRMSRLRSEMEPILLEKCAWFMDVEGLKKTYAAARNKGLEALKQDSKAFHPEQISGEIAPLPDFVATQMLPGMNRLQNGFERLMVQVPPQATYYDTTGTPAERYTARLFQDDYYQTQCTRRERALIKLAHGAWQAIKEPSQHPNKTMILFDPKGGPDALRLMEERGIQDPRELPQHLGRSLGALVVEPNFEDVHGLRNMLQRKYPELGLASNKSVYDIGEAIARSPQAVLVEDPDMRDLDRSIGLNDPARIVLTHGIMDAAVNRVIVQDAWQYSEVRVQDVVRFSMIQVGLVERPTGDSLNAEMLDWGGNPLSLYDRMALLTRRLEPAIHAGVDLPQAATALARLTAIHDMLVDPQVNRELKAQTGIKGIERSKTAIHPSFYANFDKIVDLRRDHIMPVLRQTARYIRPLSEAEGRWKQDGLAVILPDLVEWRREGLDNQARHKAQDRRAPRITLRHDKAAI